MLLKHYLEHGTTKSTLARQLGVSRDTIHRWIAGELDRDVEELRYGPRPPVVTNLDAYTAVIETRLAAYPALSAVHLLDEIRASGYTGGYSQLKVLVRRLRPTPAPAPVVRFETPAGHQAQVAFAQFRFQWGVRYALLVVLGYSRLLWCRYYRRQDMATLYDGLEDAFRYFDFTFQPSLRREQIESLHELGFVERRENVIVLGPPGVGKTHLAISFAIGAAQSGRRVYYGTLADLITSLEEAQAAGRFQARLKILTHPAVLVVDEIGYLPITRTGAMQPSLAGRTDLNAASVI